MTKPKQQRAYDPNRVSQIDRCQTPPYALDPLLPYLRGKGAIWEPCAGEGRLVDTLRAQDFKVVASDILTGQNFFTYRPEQFDIIVTNPPYGSKYFFIERCYELQVPFALLVPVETIGAGRAQKVMSKFGAELLLLNRRVNFSMPIKGEQQEGGWKSSAQFPTFWLCHGLLPSPIVYGHIEYPKPKPAMVTLPLFE